MSSIALSCARSSRVVATRRAIRAFATETLASGSSSSTQDHLSPATNASNSKRQRQEINSTDHDGKSVYVRTWDEIGSMPEFFAILRGIEKRFGLVREFRVARDPDITTKYHSYFMLEFADDAAFDRIPANGTNIKVAVPVVKQDRPGGLGLADLQGLLDPQERDPNFAPDAPEGSAPGAGSALGLYGAPISVVNGDDRPTRVVEVVVQRAKRDATSFPRQRSLHANRTFGPAFFEWGGFYTPTPQDPRPVPPDMAAALDKWREFALNDPRRAARAGEDQAGAAGMGGTGGTEVWREAEAAQKAEEEEVARREDIAVMLKGAEEPTTWKPAVATSSTTGTRPKAWAKEVDAVDAVEDVEGAEGEGEGEKAPRLSRKEQILARARLHAKTPAPEVASEEDEGERVVVERVVRKRVEKKQKEEVKEAEVTTLRERLLKLMGGKWL
ncbi:hypothetical protein GSI_04905 [Ganoderma sinense ZZ0214-1]|uniref:Uncharacterized protein n=1 Tax=Ganoderma sinense ZZ0214-1 TaxID=1077348 RepID=A0A2G8SGU6_9APHY|nr:hypothetical protein GSI_04905 [Ganoderma sinense ZZ0214-1]